MIETVKIVRADIEKGYSIINKSDFKEGVDVLYVEGEQAQKQIIHSEEVKRGRKPNK
jgi:hypothetical protein